MLGRILNCLIMYGLFRSTVKILFNETFIDHLVNYMMHGEFKKSQPRPYAIEMKA